MMEGVSLGQILVAFLFTYYTFLVCTLVVSPKKREGISKRARELDGLRAKPVKSVEEQKAFLDARFTKPTKGEKYSWSRFFIGTTLSLLGVSVVWVFLTVPFWIKIILTVLLVLVFFFSKQFSTWNQLPLALAYLAFFVILLRLFIFLLTALDLFGVLWQAVLFVLVFAFGMNYVLYRSGLSVSDMSIMFGNKKRGDKI